MDQEAERFLIAFYGDDFTGSTDALESLSKAGVKTVLFIDAPSKEKLKAYPGLQAIGIAGMTRAMNPKDMEKELAPAFKALLEINPRHVHYKVCSTFDSSPEIGSIGKALDIGAEIFDSKFVPLLVAAPALGRYCLFGNLFARMGIGSNGTIYRLDLHPSMSKHPVTPADESDLRLHLAKQTAKRSGLIDILCLQEDLERSEITLSTRIEEGNEVILFDALNQQQMERTGELLELQTVPDKPLFSVGSSGIETALSSSWANNGLIKSSQNWEHAKRVSSVLIASGSCSPTTSSQITYALSNGFAEVAIDTAEFADQHIDPIVIKKYAELALQLIEQGKNVILHTSRGYDDVRVQKSELNFKDKGMPKANTALIYGTALGQIVREIADRTTLKRVVIAGGDTSSYAARAMGIEAVEMIALFSPGAPLCRAYAPGSSIDRIEVNFKGGQVGKEDYFVMASTGINKNR
jgi:uncharacterized protein YgbK (DUF1537 family)